MCCNFENGDGGRRDKNGQRGLSGSQIEQPVDELILFAKISAADPTPLPLPIMYWVSDPAIVRGVWRNLTKVMDWASELLRLYRVRREISCRVWAVAMRAMEGERM